MAGTSLGSARRLLISGRIPFTIVPINASSRSSSNIRTTIPERTGNTFRRLYPATSGRFLLSRHSWRLDQACGGRKHLSPPHQRRPQRFPLLGKQGAEGLTKRGYLLQDGSMELE